MAASTPLVLTAGGLVLANEIIQRSRVDVKVAASTGIVALISAGLDKVVPRLGTGLAIVLLVSAVMTSGVGIAQWIGRINDRR